MGASKGAGVHGAGNDVMIGDGENVDASGRGQHHGLGPLPTIAPVGVHVKVGAAEGARGHLS